jgi:hypothetical protein
MTNADPDQPAWMCHLIRICTGRILVRNNLMNQKVNRYDPDQMAWICVLADLDLTCSPMQ